MKQYLLLFLSALLPYFGQGQIKAEIDSIDFSQFIDVQDHNITFNGSERPKIIIKITVTNSTNKNVALIQTVRPYYGMSWIEFEQDNIVYYISTLLLDTRPWEHINNDFPPMPPGDLHLAPNESVQLTFWCNAPFYPSEQNIFYSITPYWDYKDINYRQWFNEVYKSIRLVLLYNLDTGQPSVLVSQPVDKKTIITGNM
ncbi:MULTISPECIES: hypothetical protein [Alistipes]|jgi:hypothetical protein|uniref:hypothetical protein n=1 Tax=Alistipes TaxID=239759 RepID=UPI001D46F8AC|nr:hypothetical protein [Alistipes sp.]MBS6100105.1 hypothetical protein [Alistipes sp.]HJI18952.1 hypothetical protein [Rikenellaceae bacterium]